MNVIGLLLAVYILCGAASIGYLMLRASWPGIRALKEGEKLAYSALAGLSFGFLVIAAGFFVELAISMQFEKTFIYLLAFAFFVSFLMLNAYRKMRSRKRIKVSVPIAYISAAAISRRAFKKFRKDLNRGKTAKKRKRR